MVRSRGNKCIDIIVVEIVQSVQYNESQHCAFQI